MRDPEDRGPIRAYAAGRIGLVVAAVGLAALFLWLRGGVKKPGNTRPMDGSRSRRSASTPRIPALPGTVDQARRYCEKRQISLSVPADPKTWTVVLSQLPGGFPLADQLSSDDLRTGTLRRQLNAPGLARRKRAEILWRLGKTYAMRARYYRRLAPRLPNRRTARRARPEKRAARHHAIAPLARGRARPPAPGLPPPARLAGLGPKDGSTPAAVTPRRGRNRPRTRAEAERMVDRSLRMALHYYDDFVTRHLRVKQQDLVLYQYAAVLALSRRHKKAISLVEQMVQQFAFSPYTTMARVYAAGRHFGRGQCLKVREILGGIKAEGIGQFGALAGFYLGSCSQQLGDHAQALRLLKQVFRSVKSKAKRPPLSRVMGRELRTRLTRAASLKLARAYQKSGKPNEAVAFFRKTGSPHFRAMVAAAATGYLNDGLARAAAVICRDLSAGPRGKRARRKSSRARRKSGKRP